MHQAQLAHHPRQTAGPAAATGVACFLGTCACTVWEGKEGWQRVCGGFKIYRREHTCMLWEKDKNKAMGMEER